MLPYLILGGAQLAVGAAALFARYALTGAGALVVSALRLTIAALVLHGIGLFRRSATPITRAQRLTLVCAGAALAIHFATWIWSLSYTSIAISLLLVATVPLWTALIDFMVYKRTLSPRTMIAFIIGAAGLACVVAFNTTPAPQVGHELLGATLALTGALAFAIYLLLIRNVRSAIGLQTIVTHTYSYAALALIAAAIAARQPPPAFSNAQSWLGILAMAVISQLLGHTGMNASLRWFSPNAVGYSTVIEPVIGALLAFIVFHESLTPMAIAGALISLGSIAVVLREERLAAS